jgi:hypothetical protein
VRALLGWEETIHPTPTTKWHHRARGVAIVLRAGITRSDQGGYGGFSPALVV